ncbi:hypothetical protein HNQ38_001721 [Desulfovibrio intestinalis]|uniref:Uncharacterized protein n=1 Tax=Desulfovibrio intestinalis TaxID=58621 RepID=A0A7W8C3J5_9BACT|nr:hypothetical protein [Desulfovibrio intestinalis]
MRIDVVTTNVNQKRAAALPRRTATDFRVSSPGGSGGDGGSGEDSGSGGDGGTKTTTLCLPVKKGGTNVESVPPVNFQAL